MWVICMFCERQNERFQQFLRADLLQPDDVGLGLEDASGQKFDLGFEDLGVGFTLAVEQIQNVVGRDPEHEADDTLSSTSWTRFPTT